MAGPTGSPGQVVVLLFDFYDETSGVLTDPSTVQLDITFGTAVGLVADTAGPFLYSGASGPTPGQVYRLGTGQYGFWWQVPGNARSGVYVANWAALYGADTFVAFENFTVTGGLAGPSPPAADLGYWTGGISYNGLDIEFGQVDGQGIAWLWQKLEGWDGPDVTGGLLQKSGDQGAWASPQYFQARTLTWTVMASAPTQALRDTARAKLSQAIPVSDLALLRYDEPIPRQAMVRRSGKITETYPTLGDVQFAIGLVAPDPRKYSAAAKTLTATSGTPTGVTWPLTYPMAWPPHAPSAVLGLTNGGNFETRPVITVRGPITGPSLRNTSTGQAVSWSSLVLGATDTLTADFSAQQGFLNGAYRPADPGSWWWNLPPGTTTVALDAVSNPGAAMTATWSDAWI